MEMLLLALPIIVLLAYLLERVSGMLDKLTTFFHSMMAPMAFVIAVMLMCLQIPGFKGVMYDMLHWLSNHIPDLAAAAQVAQKTR